MDDRPGELARHLRDEAKDPLGALALCPGVEGLGEGRLKVDLDTPLEQLWLWGSIFSGLGVLAYPISLLDEPIPPEVLYVSGPLFVLAALLYMATDNYYLLDTSQRALLYHAKFLGRRSERRVAGFEEVAGVGVTGQRNSSRSRVWWEYALVLWLRSGRMIRLTDYKEDLLDLLNQTAVGLSDLLGEDVEVRAGLREQRLVVRRDRYGELTVTYRSGRHLQVWLVVFLAVFALVGAFGLALLALS